MHAGRNMKGSVKNQHKIIRSRSIRGKELIYVSFKRKAPRSVG